MEKKDKKFEEKIVELETLIKALENGDVPLDEAIDYFTRATKLTSECDKDLKEAEKALTSIVNEDGSLSEFKGEVEA